MFKVKNHQLSKFKKKINLSPNFNETQKNDLDEDPNELSKALN